MPIDDRTPVLVGVGQVLQRAEDPHKAQEPLELMAEATRRAAADAGSNELARRTDSIFVPQGTWKYANPAAWLAEHFGADSAETALGSLSGTTVQRFVDRAAVDIAAGKRDVVLIVGGEAEHSARRTIADGRSPRRTEQTGPPPDLALDESWEDTGIDWQHAGVLNPAMAFALFESALLHRRGEGVEAHRRHIGELWHRFAKVAEANPNAWIREAPGVDEIIQPSPKNRMVTTPYTKLLMANMVVDMAAAVFVCSVATARRLGVAEDKWVYPIASVGAQVCKPISTRAEFYEEPVMRLVAERALGLAGVTPQEVGPVDLYSCFPLAVQFAAMEAGLDLERPLTVTGGLTFGGGPFNNYVIHALSTLVERLRSEPDRPGLISSVGGLMSRYSYGLYAREPGADGFRCEDLSEQASAVPGREIAGDYEGPVEIEAAIAVHGREGPERAVVSTRTPAGARSWARSEEAELLAAIGREDLVGRPARIAADRLLEL